MISGNTSDLRPLAPSPAVNPLIVIPVYNNRPTLRAVAEAALKTGLPVLVVNDGSDDGGPETLDGLPLSRVDLAANEGKGAAILAGARWAGQRGYTHIITLDADGQHDPQEALRLVGKIQSEPCSIVIGARDFQRGRAPELSRFGRRFSNFWVRVAAGLSLPDSQSGYRAYPVEALRAIRCRGRRYEFEAEILVRGAWAGLRIQSVGVSVKYSDETKRGSHFRVWRDNARISGAYARLVARRLMPWPHKVLFHPDGNEESLSLRRPLHSFKILLKERLSPTEIVMACMLGMFLGTLPLVACHSVVILFCATRMRLNRLIAFNISHLCAPPFVPALAYELGYYLRNGRFLTHIDLKDFSLRSLGTEGLSQALNYVLGAVALAPILAALTGLAASVLVLIYSRRASAEGGAPR